MISNDIRKICKDFKKIENYSKAIKDKKTIWHCHHRLEIHSDYTNSAKDLKLMGIYYNRPPEELIFLTPKEHMQLHNNNQKKIDKIKDSLYKRFYGEDYTIDDVKDHRRAKNTERSGRWRNRHRKHYSNYQCDYQAEFRKIHPNYYKTYKKYVKDRDCGKYDGTFKDWCVKNGINHEDL